MTSPTSSQVSDIPQRRSGIYEFESEAGHGWWSPGDLGYVVGAVAGAVTLFLLFQPWLSASGPRGEVDANGFGRIDAMTSDLTSQGLDGYVGANSSSTWAVSAALAAAVTIVAVIAYLCVRTRALSCLVLASSVATAVFALATLRYLSSKEQDLRNVAEGSPSSGLAGLMHTLLGGNGPENGSGVGQDASVGLDATALLTPGIAIAGAAVVILCALRKLVRDVIRVIQPDAPGTRIVNGGNGDGAPLTESELAQLLELQRALRRSGAGV